MSDICRATKAYATCPSSLANAGSSRTGSYGLMEYSTFAQHVIEHCATAMFSLLHVCSGVLDHNEYHRNVLRWQAKSGRFLTPIWDGRKSHQMFQITFLRNLYSSLGPEQNAFSG